jgi:predicted MPP superfamily phosphohydrolase
LQLSGHTHQGQIFPMHIGTYAYNAYFAGLYKHSKCTSIYVNRGTNQWGPPARLGAWKEITVWHMHHGSNQVRVR